MGLKARELFLQDRKDFERRIQEVLAMLKKIGAVETAAGQGRRESLQAAVQAKTVLNHYVEDSYRKVDSG